MTDTSTAVASGTATGLAVLAVALRFYVRSRLKVGIAWDDWWIFLGLLMTLLTGGLLLWGVSVDPDAEKGIQQAIVDKTTNTFDTALHTTYLKISFACSILYFSVVTPIKVSILLMYRRLFAVDPSFRLQSLLLGAVVSAFWLAATIATLFNCRPLKYNWIGLAKEEYCFNYNVFWMVTGAVEVVIDTIILALPVRMVLALRLSRKSKASVIFIFLFGGFVIMTGILRVIYGYASDSRVPSNSGADLWSAVHIGMAIVCACLPPLWPLFTRLDIFHSAYFSIRQRYFALRRQYSRRDDNAQARLIRDARCSKGEASEKSAVKVVADAHTEEVSSGGSRSLPSHHSGSLGGAVLSLNMGNTEALIGQNSVDDCILAFREQIV